jgi:hypothetical protein
VDRRDARREAVSLDRLGGNPPVGFVQDYDAFDQSLDSLLGARVLRTTSLRKLRDFSDQPSPEKMHTTLVTNNGVRLQHTGAFRRGVALRSGE